MGEKMKFYETIKKYENKIIDLYVDMDGVIAEYDIGNFNYDMIRPLQSNINRIKALSDNNINVKILTICKNNKIIDEKIKWIQKHMPFFDLNKIIFLSKENDKYRDLTSKEIKSNFLKSDINNNHVNIIIDDDNEIVKYMVKNNENVIVFQVSSWID
jgi:hypothetical protein